MITMELGLMFGEKRLPKLGKGLGSSSREFKKGVNDRRDDLECFLKNDAVIQKSETTKIKV
jgi:TatA/E family protein of Tat protein translocase